jgi:hypothetical protein
MFDIQIFDKEIISFFLFDFSQKKSLFETMYLM